MPSTRTRQRRRRPGDLPDQAIIARIFALADYAVVAPDGKLYISGANIQTMWLPQFPGVAGQLFIALLLGVPWSVASEPHHVVIRALDEDRQSLPGTQTRSSMVRQRLVGHPARGRVMSSLSRSRSG